MDTKVRSRQLVCSVIVEASMFMMDSRDVHDGQQLRVDIMFLYCPSVRRPSVRRPSVRPSVRLSVPLSVTVCQRNSTETTEQNFMKFGR